jgi:hypothetical protein
MTANDGDIYFFLPRQKWPFAQEPETFTPDLFAKVSSTFFNDTSYAWTLQTYYHLRSNGIACQLVDHDPDSGIVFVTRNDVGYLTPSPRRFTVCMLADGGDYPWAQFCVSQNPIEAAKDERYVYIPHWTQPNLVPRDQRRGNRISTLCYFGHPDQLATELKQEDWHRFLNELGIEFITVSAHTSQNTDYSDADFILAIRSFGPERFDRKPATKLHNAQKAGIPAILGPESAYQQERSNEYDYIEATSYTELKQTLSALASDEEMRESYFSRARELRQKYSLQSEIDRWTQFIKNAVYPASETWHRKSLLIRRTWLLRTQVTLYIDSAKRRLIR